MDSIEGLGCLAWSISMLFLQVRSWHILCCQLCLVSFLEGNTCVSPEGASQWASGSRDQSLEMKQEGIQADSVNPLQKETMLKKFSKNTRWEMCLDLCFYEKSPFKECDFCCSRWKGKFRCHWTEEKFYPGSNYVVSVVLLAQDKDGCCYENYFEVVCSDSESHGLLIMSR